MSWHCFTKVLKIVEFYAISLLIKDGFRILFHQLQVWISKHLPFWMFNINFILDHYTFCLKCKSKCEEHLFNLDGHQEDQFLALVYNYLQFSYFKGTKNILQVLLWHKSSIFQKMNSRKVPSVLHLFCSLNQKTKLWLGTKVTSNKNWRLLNLNFKPGKKLKLITIKYKMKSYSWISSTKAFNLNLKKL